MTTAAATASALTVAMTTAAATFTFAVTVAAAAAFSFAVAVAAATAFAFTVAVTAAAATAFTVPAATATFAAAAVLMAVLMTALRRRGREIALERVGERRLDRFVGVSADARNEENARARKLADGPLADAAADDAVDPVIDERPHLGAVAGARGFDEEGVDDTLFSRLSAKITLLLLERL